MAVTLFHKVTIKNSFNNNNNNNKLTINIHLRPKRRNIKINAITRTQIDRSVIKK